MASAFVIQEVTDPEQLARARVQRERFDRNAAWFQQHAEELFERYRGKCVCIAGGEVFVAESPEQALALGRVAHPDDDGRLLEYIPRERLIRVYAHRRRMVSVP